MSGTGHSAFGIVTVAGSQGGFGPLRELIAALPASFPAPVVAVLHRASHTPDVLPSLLARRTALPVTLVDRPTMLDRGVYVAGADAEVVVAEPGRLEVAPLVRSDRRASADVLFSSAAAAYGARTLGVVLSGRLLDGAAGTRAIRGAGGRVLAQDPATAGCASMPSAAVATGAVDFALEPTMLARALAALVMWPGADDLFRVRSHPGVSLAG